MAFARVLLKLSGEALMGTRDYGIDAATVDTLALELVDVRKDGPELSVVIGGGNIYRGMSAAAAGMDQILFLNDTAIPFGDCPMAA